MENNQGHTTYLQWITHWREMQLANKAEREARADAIAARKARERKENVSEA